MERPGQLRTPAGQLAQRRGVAAVDVPGLAFVCRQCPGRRGAVEPEVDGRRRALRQAGDEGRAVDRVLAHPPVGGPLAAGDGDQARGGDEDRVVARQVGGGVAPGGSMEAMKKGPQSGENGEDVAAGRLEGEVAAGVGEEEVDLLGQGARLAGRPRSRVGARTGGERRVGRPHDHPAVPGHREEHPPVVGMGDEDGARRGQEAALEHQVDPLAGSEERRARGVVQPTHLVGPDAGGVDHRAGADGALAAGLLVPQHGARHQAVGAAGLDQRDGAQVVERHPAAVRRGAGERQPQTRVVELGVVVEDAPQEPFGRQGGQAGQRLLARQAVRGAQPQAAGEQVVDLEAEAVEGPLPVGIDGDDERQLAHQVRGVGEQSPALAQRLEHQADVALAQVAHAAVDQLGAARRGAAGEVAGLGEEGAVAARRRLDRGPQAGRAAADHQHVPRLPRGVDPGEECGPLHERLLILSQVRGAVLARDGGAMAARLPAERALY